MCSNQLQVRVRLQQHPSWNFILTSMILTGTLPFCVKAHWNTINLPEPACYIEYEKVVDRCTYSQDNFENNGYIMQSFNGSEGVWNNEVHYVNISVSYPTGFRGILQVAVFNQFKFSHVLLQIDLRTSPLWNNHPFTLKVFYLPYNLRELSVLQLRYSYIAADYCHHPDTINECKTLIRNSKLTMKSTKNSIELKLNHPFTRALKVELYGRICHSSCDDMYPSCPTNLTSIQWSNPLVELTVRDLQTAYYCARVIYNTHDQDCCSVFTETSGVHYVQWLAHSSHNFHLSTFFYVMLVVLVLIVLVTGVIYLQYCRGIVRHLSLKATPKLNSIENTQLISIQKLDPQEVELLLLYPKRDKLFMDTMTSFRKLLKVYTKDVWDPLDREQIENVARNPARWVQRVLMVPDLKIVLVETEEAVKWFDDENRTLDVSDEDLYFSTISFIHNQPELIFNYQRLLVIRFDHFKTHISHTLNIVPQKRYNMPHQLGLLIMDVINCHEYAFDHDRPNETANQFYKLTEEYQQRLKIKSEET